jgi:hypothetical protein
MQNTLILFALVLWNVGLTITLFWLLYKLRHFFKDIGRGDLIKLLDKLIEKEDKNRKNIGQLETTVKVITKEIRPHIQKVGLVRFNPFKELGGDHSFTLAMLNADDDGILLTGLHTRERTRVYIKKVKKGKSEYELSSEEKKALKKALTN